MESRLRNVAVNLVDLMFPRHCARCGDEGEVLCESCAATVVRVARTCCAFCGEGNSERTCFRCRDTHVIEGVTALASYADPVVRRVITGWKYHGDPAYAKTIERWIDTATSLKRFEGWTVVPAPLHVSRRRSRGFDQAVEIADMVALAIRGESKQLLIRQWYTAPRAQVKRHDRGADDLNGVFVAKQAVQGNVLLCDDVFTTGTTLEAAASTLKSAGASHIWAFVIARS